MLEILTLILNNLQHIWDNNSFVTYLVEIIRLQHTLIEKLYYNILSCNNPFSTYFISTNHLKQTKNTNIKSFNNTNTFTQRKQNPFITSLSKTKQRAEHVC